MNINKAVDKAFEGKSLRELANAPVSALQGVSENDAKLLLEAFNELFEIIGQRGSA